MLDGWVQSIKGGTIIQHLFLVLTNDFVKVFLNIHNVNEIAVLI